MKKANFSKLNIQVKQTDTETVQCNLSAESILYQRKLDEEFEHVQE